MRLVYRLSGGTAGDRSRVAMSQIEVSKQPNVTIQVVRGTGTYWGLSGAFELVSGDEIPNTLIILAVEDQSTEDVAMIRRPLILFEKIRNEGLNVGDSRTALMEARGHWESQQR